MPYWGDERARLVIIGLAPGLKGANRTGRPFTGDYAGDLLYRTLSRYGFAARAEGEGELRACACPFEELAFDDPARICGLDRAIWRGMLAALAPDATLSVSATRAHGDDACLATVDASETAS